MSTQDTHEALSLPAELTIYHVAELHAQWLAWLRAQAAMPDAPALVDGHAVAEVDSAGLQLLVSLQRTLADRGAMLQLREPSATLRGAAEAMGLWSCFETATQGAPA